ncbi:MAG TPA: histidinol dehydrogenase [Bacteroidota bacterium]|nr:histidinol dehydrogenase [Bacteroidota bacterium]
MFALLRSSRTIPQQVFERSSAIVREVATSGDAALARFSLQFDGVAPDQFRVPEIQFEEAERRIEDDLCDALRAAASNIEKFHRAQLPESVEVRTSNGVLCRREWRPIDSVGLYVPGGSAPLVSTVLMLGIPARIAGCREIVLCTPARREKMVPAEILVAARMVGITSVYQAGGAQAIAAMAVGTESVPPVRKIFGPGNHYVAAAKSIVSQPPYGVAIDMLAGPSELVILADESADPAWVAADLLSQAEHGIDSPVVVVSTSHELIAEVEAEVSAQMQSLSRCSILEESMKKSHAVLVSDLSQAIELINEYAPEHLILSVKEPEHLIPDIRNAGSVFVGSLTSVVFGDYASGTNHTLPTSGAAASMGGLTVESFMKPISFQAIDREGVSHLASVVKVLARAEGLDAHVNAIRVREGSV